MHGNNAIEFVLVCSGKMEGTSTHQRSVMWLLKKISSSESVGTVNLVKSSSLEVGISTGEQLVPTPALTEVIWQAGAG